MKFWNRNLKEHENSISIEFSELKIIKYDFWGDLPIFAENFKFIIIRINKYE